MQSKRIHLQSEMHDVSITELSHPALISFFISRKIDVSIATKYCKEIHYTHIHMPYFGLAFPTNSNGYVILSPYIRQYYGRPDISIVPEPLKSPAGASDTQRLCLVFENFIDFLSYLTLYQLGRMTMRGDMIVLNSHDTIPRIRPTLFIYDKVFTLFHNNAVGLKATQQLASILPESVCDLSGLYTRYKSVADLLLGKKTY